MYSAKNFEECLEELAEDGYNIPAEGSPAYKTMEELYERARKIGRHGG